MTKNAINKALDAVFGRTLVRTRTVQDLRDDVRWLRHSEQTHRDQLADAEERIGALQDKLRSESKKAKKASARAKEASARAKPKGLPADYMPEMVRLWPLVKKRTMIGHAKMNSFLEATRYVTKSQIPGAIVECGVWRGGAMMAVAMMLDEVGDHDRDLYLFDTYAGMSEPTERDVHVWHGRSAEQELAKQSKSAPIWQAAGLEDVRAGFEQVNYPQERLHFVPGKVEETIPGQAPEQIAILRLDTDWYESTKHELEQLYDRLVPGGVLIIDDYGSWQGSRDATDEFLAAVGARLLLVRVDRGRIAVKPGFTDVTVS